MPFRLQHRRPRERELWNLYIRERLPVAEIGRRYGVSEDTARRWLASLGMLEKRPTGPRPADRPRPFMPSRRYVRGAFVERARTHSITELARIYNVDRKTIRRWLAREGVKAVDGRRPSHPPLEELQALRDEGLSLARIGERYGVSRQRVHQWLATSAAEGPKT